MFSIKNCVVRELKTIRNLFSNEFSSLLRSETAFNKYKPEINKVIVRHQHKGSNVPSNPTHWLSYNKIVYPPQKPGEEPRLAYVCHQTLNLRGNAKYNWYLGCLVRGMKVDDAINQLNFSHQKNAHYVAKTIKEAKELAKKEHNVEFPSNMWVAESFFGKGYTIFGLRKRAKGRIDRIRYRYCHYFVRLEEGEPPEDYYAYKSDPPAPQKVLDYVEKLRGRHIPLSL